MGIAVTISRALGRAGTPQPAVKIPDTAPVLRRTPPFLNSPKNTVSPFTRPSPPDASFATPPRPAPKGFESPPSGIDGRYRAGSPTGRAAANGATRIEQLRQQKIADVKAQAAKNAARRIELPNSLTGRGGVNPSNFASPVSRTNTNPLPSVNPAPRDVGRYPSPSPALPKSAAPGRSPLGRGLGPAALIPPLLEGAKNYARTGNPFDSSANPPGEDKYPWETIPQAGERAKRDLERLADKAKKELDRARDGLRRLFPKDRPKVKKPPGSAPDIDLSGAIPPTGEPGQYLRVRFSYRTWDGVTGSGSRGGVAPFQGFVYVTPPNGQRQIYMQFDGYRETIGLDALPGPNGENYNTTYTITSIEPWPGGTPIPIPSPEPEPVPLPVDYGLLPPVLPFPAPKPGDPAPLHPPTPGAAPPPLLPSPATPPKPKPINPPSPSPGPAPNPQPGTPLNPGPNVTPQEFPGPTTTRTTSTNPNPGTKLDLDPDTGRITKPDREQDPFKDPLQGPEEMCKDPCMAGIQQAQKEAKDDRDKKKPVKITVDIFKDCDGENGAARFEKKEISVPADEADHMKLLYQQLASANALECRLDLSVAVPEEQIRRRPKFLPEMILFFETVRKQPNGKRSNYSMTVFHWDKPKGVKPSIPNHTKGNHIKIVTLTDGCRLSTSGKTKQEANKIMVAVLRNVPNNLKKGRGFTTKYTTSFNAKNKEVEVRCVRGKFYGSGYQPGLRPDWEIDYRKRRTTTLD